MYYQIRNILRQYGYEEIKLNVSAIHLAFREELGEGYAVVILDETGGILLSEAQFGHISEQIRGYLQQYNCNYWHFLYLLVSDYDESVGRLFQEYECFWRIVPYKGQLMVFERLDEAFMVLRRPLEEMLIQKSAVENVQKGFEDASDYEGKQNACRGEHFGDGGYSDYAKETWIEKLHAAYREKRLPICNMIFLVINVIVFLYTDLFAVFRDDGIINAGALGWYAVMEEGEWYRLFTSMFLHMDGEHLFNNMLVLGYIGSCVELELGSRRYGILYLGSGILAGCTSMVYNMLQNDYVVSIGASGAVFGTVGAMLYLVLFHKGKRLQYSNRQIAFMALFSLYGGFASQGVDNAAHFGGFVAGFALAGLLTLWQGQGKNRN